MSKMSNLSVQAEELGYYSDKEKQMFLEGLMEKKQPSEFDAIFGDTFDLTKALQ